MSIRVVNLRNYRNVENEVLVRVDRQSILGNPFRMKFPTPAQSKHPEFMINERNRVCDAYESYFNEQVAKDGAFRNEVLRIYRLVKSGKDVALGCWCAPKRCHAEYIKAFIEKQLGDPQDSPSQIFILHQTNCQDAFGSGFAGYLNRVFPTAKTRYHEFIRQMREAGFTKDTDLLGQAVEAVGDGFTIVHCFGQRYYGNSRNTGRCYTDYNAVEQALARFRKRHPHDTAICPQYMGCGLAGGDWERYSAILAKYNIIPCKNINLANHTFVRASK